MATQFKNTGEHLSTFADEFWVVCPRCAKDARVVRVESPDTLLKGGTIAVHARISCLHCAYVQEKALGGYGSREAVDWYFRLPLWFQSLCCGETLWAYNRRHLDYLERYVSADLRDECSWPNTGLARYLPKWMKDAKHREEILRCIAKLKQP